MRSDRQSTSPVALAAGLLLVLCAACGGDESDSPPSAVKADWEQLENAAERDGNVRVIVTLALDTVAEGELSPEQREVQREAIAAEQRALLEELRGTEFEQVSTYQAVPQVALRVSREGVDILRDSQRVAAVTHDRPVGP